MTLQKINIGAAPNDGTGDNNRAAWQKVNAALSEVDSLGTGKLDANDPSVTNAREWTASEVTQAEAEAGTATTARKWTAQRVRQAVDAWWNTIGTVFGKTLLASSNAAAARTNLGLGNVDNTSDSSKPISTATATALAAKQATLVSGTNIKTINGESLLGPGNIYVGLVEKFGTIGVAGKQGFGVGIYPTTLPAGFSNLPGTQDSASANYGNYVYSDGSVMVFIPRFYYRIGHTSSPNYALYGMNAIDIAGVDTFATEAS